MEGKRRVTRKYHPRGIDRILFGILALLHVANGLYLVGPWYLDEWEDAGAAPLQNLFNSDLAVVIYGAFLLINGLFLVYGALGKSVKRWYSSILSITLLSGFLVRLYSFIGVVLVLESWRPPAYLSHFATVIVLGAYWVWMRVERRNVRTVQ